MAAMPWRFKSSYPHQSFWGCSSVDRALRSHRRGRGFESHQLHQNFIAAVWRFFIDKYATHAVVYYADFLSSGDMAEW